MNSRNFPLPQAGAWRRHSCLLEWILEGFPLEGMRCFTWKMGFRHWGSEGWSGGGPVWGCDLPGPSHCLLSSKSASPCSHQLLALSFVLKQKVLAQCLVPAHIQAVHSPFTWAGCSYEPAWDTFHKVRCSVKAMHTWGDAAVLFLRQHLPSEAWFSIMKWSILNSSALTFPATFGITSLHGLCWPVENY